MLFIFETNVASAFWMRDMRLPLDFIWISEECTVADITRDVPAPEPDTPVSRLPRYESEEPAAYNFEVNAGEADRHGVKVGDPVTFVGLDDETGGVCR